MKQRSLRRYVGATLAGSLSCLTVLACASELAPPADLPPRAAVEQALAAQPMVRAAQAERAGAQAEHGVLKAGEHEFGLRFTTQRRNVRGGPEHTEWGLALERGLRLPGKAALDDQIGAQGVYAAQEMIGDARHESARQLLALWYGARQASLEAGLWRRQAELLKAQQGIVESRVKRGDAARLEIFQAEAALAQALSMGAQAEARAQTARAELAARFPELPVPDDSVARPQAPAGDAAHWLEHTLEHNHELLVARHTLDKANLQVRRAEANRLPDPTVGLFLTNEQGGDERIIGLSLSLPLPGEARLAQAQVHQAHAEALAQREAATRQRLIAEATANWQRASAGVESWRRLESAAEAMQRHAELARRAHALGELGLSETLLAQRAALEAELASGQARLAANEAIARLMLDAHQLWPMAEGDRHD